MELDKFARRVTELADETIAVCSSPPRHLASDTREEDAGGDAAHKQTESGWEELERQRKVLSNIEQAIIRKRKQRRQQKMEQDKEEQQEQSKPPFDAAWYCVEQSLFVVIAAAVWASAVYTGLSFLQFPFHRHQMEITLAVVLPGAALAGFVALDTRSFLAGAKALAQQEESEDADPD